MSNQDHASYPGDDFDTFDATDEEGGLPGLVVLVMALLVLVAFGAVVWIAYQQGLRQGGRNAPPLIVAEPGPAKVERSATTPLANEREVYDILSDNAEERTQIIAPPPEEPVDRATGPAFAEAPAEDPLDRPATPEDDNEPLERSYETAAGGPVEAEAPAVAAVPPAPRASAPASTASPPPARVTAPQTASIPAPRPAGASGGALAGSHVVQVSSSPTRAAAEQDWSRMQGRYEDILAGRSRHVQEADLGDKGIYYRLRIGPFYSKSEADAFCTTLKGRGQDCITRSAG
ncbi:MAG: SPOR domain-containing protein [Pseudomonadota bacterium]